MEGCAENKKRVRDELEDSRIGSPRLKLPRVGLLELGMVDTCTEENSNVSSLELEQIGSDAEQETVDLSAEGEIQDDLLDILEDSDAIPERDSTLQGLQLDSFIKSFEEEIQTSSPVQPSSEMTTDHIESQPELGYLYEASDDELGLPPAGGSKTGEKIESVDFTTSSSGIYELDGNLGFEDDIPCYDSFEIGIGIDSGGMSMAENEFGGEFVALGGLFDYSDVPIRPESLSAS